MDFRGKVVVITGGAGGLGSCFAKAFLKFRAKVFLLDIKTERLEEITNKLSLKFGKENVGFCKCDVTKEEDLEISFTKCEEQLGTIDILINNAGIRNGQDFTKCIDVNLHGTIRGTELMLKRMNKHNGGKGGHIVNIGSLAGITSSFIGPFYGASKAGVVEYTRSIGHEFHYQHTGVNVQCICPSMVDTPFLDDSQKTSYNEHTLRFFEENSAKFPRLRAKEVANGLFKLIRENKLGATMVLIKNLDPYYADDPVTNFVLKKN